jgi:prevent-host-death family protein
MSDMGLRCGGIVMTGFPFMRNSGRKRLMRPGAGGPAGRRRACLCAPFTQFARMKETTVSVREAGRNFANCVKRARTENMSFVVVTNGVPVARLVPAGDFRCTGRKLAAALTRAPLSRPAARAWHAEWTAARTTLPSPEDKWR